MNMEKQLAEDARSEGDKVADQYRVEVDFLSTDKLNRELVDENNDVWEELIKHREHLRFIRGLLVAELNREQRHLTTLTELVAEGHTHNGLVDIETSIAETKAKALLLQRLCRTLGIHPLTTIER